MSASSRLRIGIDIVDEKELRALARDERALAKVFTPRELSACETRGEDRHAALARRFAAKEALVKAWGRPVGNLAAIEITHGADGEPIVHWECLQRNGLRAELSISSASPVAVAVAVLYHDET